MPDASVTGTEIVDDKIGRAVTKDNGLREEHYVINGFAARQTGGDRSQIGARMLTTKEDKS